MRGCWRRERDDGNKVSFFDDAITRRRARRAALGGEVEFRCIGHERGLPAGVVVNHHIISSRIQIFGHHFGAKSESQKTMSLIILSAAASNLASSSVSPTTRAPAARALACAPPSRARRVGTPYVAAAPRPRSRSHPSPSSFRGPSGRVGAGSGGDLPTDDASVTSAATK